MTGMAAAAGGLAAGAGAEAAAQTAERADAPGKRITHVVMFVHPPVTYSMNKLLKPAPEIHERLYALVEEKAKDPATALCILQSSRGDKPLVERGTRAFGGRCVVDPNDNAEATRVLTADDANRACSRRGNHGEWVNYELWSSNNARRWAEGFKKTLAERGYALDTDALTMETFGSWSGCHHKYSNFMAAYLGLKQPAEIHAEMEYCTHKGMPMDVAEFVETTVLDRHVVLALFRREDGCPMAQFWDGLRPFHERPHLATVAFPPGEVDLYAFSPNSLIPVESDSRKRKDGFVADVGDGCRPVFTTIVGHSGKDADVERFCAAMRAAVISPVEGPPGVYYAVET